MCWGTGDDIINFVKKGFVEEVYGRALSHAKDRREVADYDIEKNISEEKAESIVEDAERFLVRIILNAEQWKEAGFRVKCW